MITSMKRIIVGALALAGVFCASAETQAMPIQPLSPAVASEVASGAQVEHVYFYGYRRPFLRFGYGYRPFFRYRRFGYGYPVRRFYGYRRPFYGYGYRRF